MAQARLLGKVDGLARAGKADLEDALSRVSGERLTIEFLEPLPREEGDVPAAAAESPLATVEDHPLVQEAKRLFDARVVHVRPRAPRTAPTSED